MKINDIRPDDLMVGQAAAEQMDIDWLKSRREEFVAVSCPACGEDRSTQLYEKNGMPHVVCGACGTQYANPRPDKEMLGAFYAQSENYSYFAKHIFPASKEARREKVFRPRVKKVGEIAGRYGLSGSMLEIGSAYGLFCDEVRSLGLFDRIIGIEPTPELAQICRDMDIEVIEKPYEDVVLDEPVDVIAHFEVIEHLFDPQDFLRWCNSILKPGGFMISTCPNIAGFEARVAGRASGVVDHEHINLFSTDSLGGLYERCGFKVVECETPGELDIELLQRSLESGSLSADQVDPLLFDLITHDNQQVKADFLAVLQSARMTSNMFFLVQKV